MIVCDCFLFYFKPWHVGDRCLYKHAQETGLRCTGAAENTPVMFH